MYVGSLSRLVKHRDCSGRDTIHTYICNEIGARQCMPVGSSGVAVGIENDWCR